MCTTARTATPVTPAATLRAGVRLAIVACVLAALMPAAGHSQLRTSFKVRYVAEGAVYLDGGRSAGLVEGQRLTVRRKAAVETNQPDETVAELEVASVASSSAVCSVITGTGPLRAGDIAYFQASDLDKMTADMAARQARGYLQVVTFSEGDPLDEEVREEVPRPPLPEINRARGRFGLEYGSIRDTGAAGISSSQLGFVARADMTRIGGSYWNFSGYYRGRVNRRQTAAAAETLSDLINRTYHLSLTYNNPGSRWVAGAGRFLLPWASSLNTIDGGYVGRRLGKSFTSGVFAGSSPDPTSWNYDPNRQLVGAFSNIEKGNFDSLRCTSTFGLALSRVGWKPDRQFGFFENGLFYKQQFSLFQNTEVDLLRDQGVNQGLAVSRSFVTARIQPHRAVAFDISDNYFREIPTFDERLVGTGLVDRLLFQGLTGGVRLELPHRVSPYITIGRSSRTGDSRPSWNHLAGVTFRRIPFVDGRIDLRYSRFDSSFGRGSYRSVSISREVGERLRFDLQVGEQSLVSALSAQNKAWWANFTGDWFIQTHYFLGTGLTVYRGNVQSYDQWFLNFGYRY
jgi:hypothetical protein